LIPSTAFDQKAALAVALSGYSSYRMTLQLGEKLLTQGMGVDIDDHEILPRTILQSHA
jgi:hypothetical protein